MHPDHLSREGTATPLTPGRSIEYEVPDMYGRPWAQIWEQYWERGMKKPEEDDLFDFNNGSRHERGHSTCRQHPSPRRAVHGGISGVGAASASAQPAPAKRLLDRRGAMGGRDRLRRIDTLVYTGFGQEPTWTAAATSPPK